MVILHWRHWPFAKIWLTTAVLTWSGLVGLPMTNVSTVVRFHVEPDACLPQICSIYLNAIVFSKQQPRRYDFVLFLLGVSVMLILVCTALRVGWVLVIRPLMGRSPWAWSNAWKAATVMEWAGLWLVGVGIAAWLVHAIDTRGRTRRNQSNPVRPGEIDSLDETS